MPSFASKLEAVPLRLERYSYRHAEQILNSKLALKEEIEGVLLDRSIEVKTLSRRTFNRVLKEKFVAKGWISESAVFGDSEDLGARMDFFKERIGIEVGFGHANFMGTDLLKFQVSSYSVLDNIDVGIYIVTTAKFQKSMMSIHGQNWEGSLSYEKVVKYLPQYKSAIQVPLYVMGITI